MRIPDLENLKQVFCLYPEIRAAYLFGSRASGRVHREIDLDLAVLHDGDCLPEKKLDILAQLAAEGFCDVDFVFLPKDRVEPIRSAHLIRISVIKPHHRHHPLFCGLVFRIHSFALR